VLGQLRAAPERAGERLLLALGRRSSSQLAGERDGGREDGGRDDERDQLIDEVLTSDDELVSERC